MERARVSRNESDAFVSGVSFAEERRVKQDEPQRFIREENTMSVVFANTFATALAPLFMDGDPVAAPAGSGPFQMVVMTFVVLIALFFVFVLPNKAKDKQMKKMIDSIKIHDKILTHSGIIGTVVSIDAAGGEIVLRVDNDNNVKIHFSLSSVYYVFDKDAAKKEKETKKDKSAKN